MFLKCPLRVDSQDFMNAPDPKKPSEGDYLTGGFSDSSLLPKHTRATGATLACQKQELFLQPTFGLPPLLLSLRETPLIVQYGFPFTQEPSPAPPPTGGFKLVVKSQKPENARRVSVMRPLELQLFLVYP